MKLPLTNGIIYKRCFLILHYILPPPADNITLAHMPSGKQPVFMAGYFDRGSAVSPMRNVDQNAASLEHLFFEKFVSWILEFDDFDVGVHTAERSG